MIPRPPPSSPIRTLERLWLLSSCAYEVFDANLMADEDWDKMGKELWDRRGEWSPYFRHSLPSPEFNPGTTASGVNWDKGLPLLYKNQLAALDGDYSSLLGCAPQQETAA